MISRKGEKHTKVHCFRLRWVDPSRLRPAGSTVAVGHRTAGRIELHTHQVSRLKLNTLLALSVLLIGVRKHVSSAGVRVHSVHVDTLNCITNWVLKQSYLFLTTVSFRQRPTPSQPEALFMRKHIFSGAAKFSGGSTIAIRWNPLSIANLTTTWLLSRSTAEFLWMNENLKPEFFAASFSAEAAEELNADRS